MAKVVILGTSSAVPDENHENTHLAVVGQRHTVLIDCASTPIVRLKKAGIDFNNLSDIILTHFHPDHVSGIPLLLMNMWILGRRKSLNIYGLHHTLERVEDLMSFHGWSSWPDFFPVAFYRLPNEDMTTVLENDEFRIISSPVRHWVPTIGLRIEFVRLGKALAYSSDTEPCPQTIALATDANVLIHEATGAETGHSSASQAAGIAREAGVDALYLIHYPTGEYKSDTLLDEAKDVFSGDVFIAEDFMELDFD